MTTPEPDEHVPEPQTEPREPLPERKRPGFFRSLLGLIWVIFCFEVGVFLLIYPWMSGWNTNFFSYLFPEMHGYWANSYLRGAISGLGVVNICIAMAELFQFLKTTLFGD